VRTSSAYGGILAIAGELENNIRIIYKSIYEKLNINDVAEKNLQIKILND
jgi:ABC-type sulfate transport system permease component